MFRSARDHHQGITAQHSTMPTLAKYVGCFQDTEYPSIHPPGTTALGEPWPPQLPASTALYPSPSLSTALSSSPSGLPPHHPRYWIWRSIIFILLSKETPTFEPFDSFTPRQLCTKWLIWLHAVFLRRISWWWSVSGRNVSGFEMRY